MTFPTDQPAPEYDLADVLHLLIDHGRLPDEVTALACHRAVDDFVADTPPAADTTESDTVSADTAPAVDTSPTLV